MAEIVNDVWTDPIDVRNLTNEIQYNLIIKEFEGLSLEDKVDRLIKAYASSVVYGSVRH